MVKKTSNLRFLGINFVVALSLLLVMLIIVLIWLRHYTDHGHEIEVPQITGLYAEEAQSLLSGTGLKLEINDSTFSNKVPLGTIVEQMPPAESKVKLGRSIYVVINASAKRQVAIPELHDVSYRQAENMLRQLGLGVGEIQYVASAYSDLVLDVRVGESSVEAGTVVTEGTVVSLVVGRGQGSEMVSVPSLSGLHLSEARSTLLSYQLTLGHVDYDETPDETTKDEFVVYMQQPQSGTMLLEGSMVRVSLSRDIQKAANATNVEDEDEFF